MELYARVRRAVVVDKMSEREAARQFGLARETVRKMLRYAVPPGYRRKQPARRHQLDTWVAIIDQILEEDQARGKKQRPTAKRIFERLREEQGFTGGSTIVKDSVRLRKLSQREMFVPLEHPPGDAQADFGEAMVVIGGVERKAHSLAVDLPHSDDCFAMAFPAETTEAFLEGHHHALAYFGGVPRTILYDNTKLAVARILGDGTRTQTRAFPERQSHDLFAEKFGRPGKGNDHRGRSRDWGATRGGTSWCRFHDAPAGRSSMRTCWRHARSGESASFVGTTRPSGNGSRKTRRCCCRCRRRLMKLARNARRG